MVLWTQHFTQEVSEIALEFPEFDQFYVQLYRRYVIWRISPSFIRTTSPPISVFFLWKMKIPQDKPYSLTTGLPPIRAFPFSWLPSVPGPVQRGRMTVASRKRVDEMTFKVLSYPGSQWCCINELFCSSSSVTGRWASRIHSEGRDQAVVCTPWLWITHLTLRGHGDWGKESQFDCGTHNFYNLNYWKGSELFSSPQIAPLPVSLYQNWPIELIFLACAGP